MTLKNRKRTPAHWSTFFSLLLIFTVLGTFNVNAQLKTVTEMKDKDWTDLSLFFYPSTLRMINTEQIEEFNRLIKDIDKMVFYSMNNKFDEERFYEFIKKLIINDDMEEYLVIDGKGKKLYLLGREDPAETVGVAELDGKRYVFDIAGALELSEIPKLYRYIAENDQKLGNQYKDLLSLFGQDNFGLDASFKP